MHIMMHQHIAPIPVRPWTLNGISERTIVSHYENNYGSTVRTLNAIRHELAELEPGTPLHRLSALKREELAAADSVALHELYFGNLGGEGNKMPEPIAATIEEHFGSVASWRSEFVRAGAIARGGIGLGADHISPSREALLEPDRGRSRAVRDRFRTGACARHV
jgi:Fe-Mn family superoxide dismutase